MDNKDLVLDLLAWIGKESRPYDEGDGRLANLLPTPQIWEDAVDHGLVQRRDVGAEGTMVDVTEKGRDFFTTMDGLRVKPPFTPGSPPCFFMIIQLRPA